jgi:hypothetical protein
MSTIKLCDHLDPFLDGKEYRKAVKRRKRRVALARLLDGIGVAIIVAIVLGTFIAMWWVADKS